MNTIALQSIVFIFEVSANILIIYIGRMPQNCQAMAGDALAIKKYSGELQ